ncbi:SDR family NAD(P)-dependent oxidoreductase [Terrarubrum flagellatum]|uniref:SDR family NAD(P)-dependent oxidoreductase n=1 Tax=Terrirubrum flagellatum TaxID=2895980 RepID=UPI0031454385
MKAAQLFDVTGKVALVTGGAAGIGRAYAEVMAANGADVVLLDRDAARLDGAVGTLRTMGRRIEGIPVDVADRAALRTAIDDALRLMGRLDVVFANAGVAAGPGFLTLGGKRNAEGALDGIPDALWDTVIATNLTSVVTTIAAVTPHMKERRDGRIIVTASIAGLRPGPIVGSPYLIAKAAVLHLVKQAALELVRYGVLVNAIVPGPFLTDLTTPELKTIFEAGSPMHRVADVDEVKGLALFLASPASSYVTGAHLVIDGGASLGRAD